MRAKCLIGRGSRILRLSCMLLAAMGCVRQDDPGALERARSSGLRAGFALEPPYAFVDPADGEPTGEAPEILRLTADEIGIRNVQWYPVPFHDLTSALIEGRIDVIASGMFVSSERSRQVRFSVPTACVRPLLITRRAESGVSGSVAVSPERDGAGCEGCRVAVIQGSVEHGALEKHGAPDQALVVVPDLSTAVAAVRDSVADVLAISAPTARDIVRRNSGLMLDARTLPQDVLDASGGCPAFAFRHGDEDLALAFDSALSEFIGTGAHLDLVTPFGFTQAEVGCRRMADGTATSAAACVAGE